MEPITGNQLDHARKLGSDQGVGADIFQAGIDGGDLAAYMAGLKTKYDPSGLWRVIDDLAIQIPALPRPSLEEVRARWSGVKRINFDNSPTEAVTLSLGTLLRKDEPSINGVEYERRRKPLTGLVGFQHGLWLEKCQEEYPAFKALMGRVYIDLPGIEVVNADGGRSFPYLSDDGERWRLGLLWAGGGLVQSDRVGRSRT